MIETISSLQDLDQIAKPQTEAAPAQPQLDRYGRAYATGKRKNAVARVWIKPGRGEIKVNGRDVAVFFARPTLRMVINQPFVVAGSRRSVRRDVHRHRRWLVGPGRRPAPWYQPRPHPLRA